MSGLLQNLRIEFQDENARYAYVEAYLNASIAAEIKAHRGNLSQQELADKIGTKQSGISRLENANYSSWKVDTLRKLARAFGLRLRISFEEFGTIAPEIETFGTGVLKKRSFDNDPAFKGEKPSKKSRHKVGKSRRDNRVAVHKRMRRKPPGVERVSPYRDDRILASGLNSKANNGISSALVKIG